MEWLILYRKEHVADAMTIQQVLALHELTSNLLPVEQITNLDDESINLQIKNSTYCILLDNELLIEDKISFFYGYLVGHTKYFYSLKNEWSKSMEFFKNVLLFSGFSSLQKKLEKNLAKIIAEENSSAAFSRLFNDGMPFTADCFATFIADDNREVCERFIQAGIDINCRTKDGTPMLNVALRAEQDSCFDWILTHKVDIDAISSDRGYSAVMDAVWKNNLRAIKILVEKNANLTFISRDGQSILVLAVGIGNPEVCKVLAEAGADPDVKDNMGMSAFEYAKLFNKTEIVSVLEKFHK